MSKDPLQALLAPDSIVIIGASSDSNKLTGRPLFNLARDGFSGRVYPINPRHESIAGLPCFVSLQALPEVPDLAVVMVAAERVCEQVDALGRFGVKVTIVCSSGFAEVGEAGKHLEVELLTTARRYGMRLAGPNNLGLVNAFRRMPLTFSQYADEPVRAGPVGFVSQSGAFGTAVAALARGRGLGLGYFVSTGNQLDIDAIEVLDRIVEDPGIRVVVGYLEGLRDGGRLFSVAAKALALGKPVVIVKVGRHDAGSRAALSHTGALAGDDAVFDGVMQQCGILRAGNEMHALDLAGALVSCPPAEGRGIGLVTISGGAGVMMADLAEDHGLTVPVLSDHSQARLKSILRGFAAVGNPVDVTGQVLEEPGSLAASLIVVGDDPAIAAAVVWLQMLDRRAHEIVDALIAYRASAIKPLVVCWLNAPDEAIGRLRDGGVCTVTATESAVQVVAGLVEFGEALRRFRTAESRRSVPSASLRDPSTDDNSIMTPTNGKGLATRCPAARVVSPVASIEAAHLLREAGLDVVETRFAATPADAARRARDIGFPVALKIESPDIAHKSDAGGVRLNLMDESQVESIAAEILRNAGQAHPLARLDGLLVQAMGEPGCELVLGLRRDPVFGPVVMVGLGGIFIEVLRDVSFGRAPLTRDDAHRMLARLRGGAILYGARGRPAVHREALVTSLCRLSEFALNHPEINELDLNPVFAGPRATVAVDWLMTRESRQGRDREQALSTARGCLE